MKKRLQVILSDDAWSAVENLTTDSNSNFDVGSINYSDVINEMILCSKVDLKVLQAKHTDLKRSLRVLATKETLDIDAVIKSLMELKSKTGRRKSTSGTEEVSA